MYRPLPIPLNDSSWLADFDFTPMSGTYAPAGWIFALTAGRLNPYTYDEDATLPTDQDGIWISYSAPLGSNTPSNWAFTVQVKNDANIGSSVTTTTIASSSSMGTTYYFRMERISATQGQASIYSNAARTQGYLIATASFSIPADVKSLTYLQHSTTIIGSSSRIINASLDNTVITNKAQTTGVYEVAGSARMDAEIFPNPGTGAFKLKCFIPGLSGNGAYITVYNMMGQVVKADIQQAIKGHNIFDLSLENEMPGVYLVKLEYGNSSSFLRVNVIH